MHTHRWLAPMIVLTLLASALITPAAFAQDQQPNPFGAPFKRDTILRSRQGAEYVPGQLLVRLRDGAQLVTKGADTTRMFQARFASLKISTATWIAPQTYRLTVPANADIEALARQTAADPNVAFAQPNYQRFLLRTANDPLSTFQYGLSKMDTAGAWDITTGSSAVTIAIIDTGLKLNHPEFAGRVLPGFDFADNDNNPTDEEGHGTHVAGIALASGDNGQGVAGMCWQCRVLPVKVFDRKGAATNEGVARAIRWAADQGARVINLSLGGDEDSPIEHDAIKYATSKNVLVIASAGNSFEQGNPVEYPAAYDEVIAVGATEENDQRAFFSAVQPYVDVSAPGWNIASTFIGNAGQLQYIAQSGTSMSAPYVAGLAGLLLSVNANLDVNALRTLLTSTSDDLGQPGLDWEYGAGRINAARAVAAARNQVFAPVPNPNQPGVTFFPETQHTLRSTFKAFWEQNGGLPVFGFPVSEEFQETSAEGTFTVQYFERNRFEFHPEKPAPYNVLLGRLSDVQLKSQGRDWFAFPKGQEAAGCQFFAETGHSVCEPFLSYWKRNGLRDQKLSPDGRSLALFGLPLSEAAPEVNSSGENVLTQWFERARFEFHPDKPAQFQVLLGLLGNETARSGSSGPPSSGQTPPDRCGFVPAPVSATVKPSTCLVIGTEVEIVASGFMPGEKFVFIRTAPNGEVEVFDPSKDENGEEIEDPEVVDEQGNVVSFVQVVLPPGLWTITTQGVSSGHQATFYLQVVGS